MRLFDEKSNQTTNNFLLLLTPIEARDLQNSLNALIQKYDTNIENQHEHICDLEYLHELTIAIYDDKSPNNFNDRTIKIIKEDK